MTHAEFTPGQSVCPGNLTARYQLSRRSGQYTVYRCQMCQWTNAPYRRRRGTQADQQPMPEQPGVTQMKIRIGASLKSGLPNYGSLGSSAEIELTLDDEITVEQAMSAVKIWQRAADQVVEDEQARKAARYPGPQNTPQPAAAAPARTAEPAPSHSEPREPRRWNPEDLPPAAQPPYQPEGYGAPAEPGPPQRNGNGAPARSGNGRGKPRSGRELIGWANGQSKYQELLAIANRIKRGRIVDWDQDLVDWAYNDLSRPVGAGWGDRRN